MILGVGVFILIGIFLSNLVAPTLTSFILEQNKLNSVVFANRLAAEHLRSEYFLKPAEGEVIKYFENFVGLLQVPGLFRIKIWNPEGVIVYSDKKELIGQRFSLTPEFKRALNLEVSVEIKKLDSGDLHNQYEAQFGEAIETYVPLTFGDSPKVVGVLETYSRAGFLLKQINEVRDQFIWRIVISLIVMFASLSFIVWQASLTIRERTWRLEEALVEARAADRAKSEFLSTMSHELRTPLNSILGFVRIILMGLTGKVNAEQEKQLKMVEKSGEHLLTLINEVLDLSKIEAGRVELRPSTFDIYQACQEVLSQEKPLALTKGIELKLEGECRGEIFTDRERFSQVLLNLVSNAVKFTKSGSVSIRCDRALGVVSISVIDTGIGIKPEDFSKLFMPFSQVDMGSTREFGGTGLGLSIVKKNLALLGGKVKVESEYGKGSTFTMVLPLRVAPRSGYH